MEVVIIALLCLVLLVTVLKAVYKPQKTDAAQGGGVGSAGCATCSGSSEKCEQECMMEASTQPVEYFDDEELDRFSRRESSSYTDEEAEEFAEVLHTMRQNEVKDWCRSLTLRGINLPDQVKDEAFMLMEG